MGEGNVYVDLSPVMTEVFNLKIDMEEHFALLVEQLTAQADMQMAIAVIFSTFIGLIFGMMVAKLIAKGWIG